MEANNIITAPAVKGVNKLYEIWKIYNLGTFSDFYRFITAPSVARSEFMARIDNIETCFVGQLCSQTLIPG